MSSGDVDKVALEAHAYTPGLKVKAYTVVKRLRRLPLPGEVFVKVGDQVDFATEVARTMIPGEPHLINAAAKLGIEKDSLADYMKKKIGDKVSKDERIAGFTGFFGLMKNWVLSPADGYIENVSKASGQVVVRENPVPVSIRSYVGGRVVEVLEREGALIEAEGAFIQGIFGIGGETHGQIHIIVKDPRARLTEDLVTPDCRGMVLVGGALATGEALKRCLKVGVAGVITGGILDVDLEGLLGYEIGVAITGEENIGLTIVITEGFGEMAMNPRTLELLGKHEGRMAAISGATQIRAGVIRPEVIIPTEASVELSEREDLTGGMMSGTPVRIIRQPYFGALGKVVSLPVELAVVETESDVRVVEVALEDGRRVVVPRANVEIIEV